ncbi:MAG: hypothetical protein HYV27_22295 [Candidatus Hydrogenedentes bacterium]|nr:hypothetical protein [Candidatus Hydrogenedentota bacterium]
MEERVVSCRCGHRMNVSGAALGSWGKCAACGADLCVTPYNSRVAQDVAAMASLWGDEGGAEPPEEPAKIVERQESQCARCGRPFRGNWDRIPVAQGYLCHICHNHTSNQPSNMQRPLVQVAEAPRPIERVSTDAEKNDRWRRIRGTLVLAAVGAVMLVLVNLFPVERWIAEFFNTSESIRSGDQQLSGGIRFLVAGLLLFNAYLGEAAVIGITFWATGRLVEEEWHLNLFYVLGISFLFWLPELLTLFMPVGVTRITVTLIKAIILIDRFDFGVGQLFVYAFAAVFIGLTGFALDAFVLGIAAGLFL